MTRTVGRQIRRPDPEPGSRLQTTHAQLLSSCAGWFGLGPVVFGLILLHIAALAFWIVALLRTSAGGKPAKSSLKQQ